MARDGKSDFGLCARAAVRSRWNTHAAPWPPSSHAPLGRGGARAVMHAESQIAPQLPMREGMVWNTVNDPEAPQGCAAPISESELW